MIISREEQDRKKLRIITLEITEISLKTFQKTKDRKFLNYAKFFGNKSKELKNEKEN
jgi:hypothetical protein